MVLRATPLADKGGAHDALNGFIVWGCTCWRSGRSRSGQIFLVLEAGSDQGQDYPQENNMAATTLRGLSLKSTTVLNAALRQPRQTIVPALVQQTFQQQRFFASRNEAQGKQILIRDHGVFG